MLWKILMSVSEGDSDPLASAANPSIQNRIPPPPCHSLRLNIVSSNLPCICILSICQRVGTPPHIHLFCVHGFPRPAILYMNIVYNWPERANPPTVPEKHPLQPATMQRISKQLTHTLPQRPSQPRVTLACMYSHETVSTHATSHRFLRPLKCQPHTKARTRQQYTTLARTKKKTELMSSI